ncbi:hypothetical protein AGMMS50239_24440 [Bacteroidia bacterium]|nr:hypothetical protein AGMMS50239_24440 [Bacteroidia bacterium]
MNQNTDNVKNYPVDVPVKLLSSQSSSSSCNPNLEGDTVYIFNSREELTNDLSCLDVRNIDWNESSFLAVKIQRFNADSKVTKSSLQEVSAGQYQLNVEITPSATQNVAPLYFYMTVPKLSKDADIGLSISIPEQFNVGTFQLKGTQWKLAGYVDVSTGKMTDAEPKDCAQCYTLAFQSDSLGTGKSVGNGIAVDLTLHPFFRVLTEINDRETGNAALFYEAAKTIDMHFWDSEGLKFFYNNRKNYMLYKQVSTEDLSENNNKKVKLEGHAYLFINSVSDETMGKLQQERDESGIVAWMVYNNQTNSATLHILSQKENSTSIIKNYPEYAKQWEVSSAGQKIYYRGDAIWTGAYLSVPPFVGYDLELTLLEKSKN